MSNTTEIKNLLEKEVQDSIVFVGDMTGTDDHLDITVVSDVFKGLPLLKQHRLVMDILKVPLGSNVHAVKIKTMTKEKYNQEN